MTRSYGVPYMGSKNRIAEWVVGNLPASHTLVDLFAGGCAVTHAAMLSGKWECFIANDISDAPRLFRDAVEGRYANEERWISREDFFMFKDSDPYIRWCWSFGNDGKSYMYSRELEPFKRALHRMLFAKTVEARSVAYRTVARELYALCTAGKETNKTLKSLESLGRLESLQSLGRLQSHRNYERLTILHGDYRAVEIPDGATVYCDPPYKGTKGYGYGFDHEAFYDWMRDAPFPVYVTEYGMPEDFTEVASIGKCCPLSATNKSRKTTERLFVHERWAGHSRSRRLFTQDMEETGQQNRKAV